MNKTVHSNLKRIAEELQSRFNYSEVDDLLLDIEEIEQALKPISNDEVRKIIENAWGVLEIENFTGTSTSGVLEEEAKIDIFDCLSENSKRILTQYISQLEESLIEDNQNLQEKNQKLQSKLNKIEELCKSDFKFIATKILQILKEDSNAKK